jgi:deoxycytidine triphosphate deaminase
MNQTDLEKMISLPGSYKDLVSFETWQKGPLEKPWPQIYQRYQNELVRPWLRDLHSKYGKLKQLSDFREVKDSDVPRVDGGGVFNLSCGFFLSVNTRNEMGYIPTGLPISYLVKTINVLPYIIQAQEENRTIPLNEIIDTNNTSQISPFGIVVPPNEQVMIYTIEHVSVPNEFIGQATTKSGIGRRGLDTVATAGTFNRGWRGVPLLETNNRNAKDDVLVEIGVPIAQFYLIPTSCTEGTYNGRFQDQIPQES